MIPKNDNPRTRDRVQAESPLGANRTEGGAEIEPREKQAPVANTAAHGAAERSRVNRDAGSIEVVFDLRDPDQARRLEAHQSAFAKGHTDVEHLTDGRAVLRLFPGGAGRLS